MARFADALEQARWTNKVLLGITAGAGVIAIYSLMALRAMPKDFTAHIPPDLSKGATVKIGVSDVPSPNVYTFAFYIWQQINRWSKSGQQDYGDQIFKLQSYITPGCREQLIADQKQRADQGELDLRTRAVMEIQGLGYVDDRVTKLADGSWAVMIDAQVQETSRGIPVKDAFIRYPLHVVRFDVDRERNPWQLAIDCYVARPERLDPKAVQLASSNGTMVQNTEAYANKSLGDGGTAAPIELAPPAAGPAASATQTSASGPQDGSGHSAFKPRVLIPSIVAPAILPRIANR